MEPDEANKMLHIELHSCDGKMEPLLISNERNDGVLAIHSCYCLEKYIDAIQSIVKFNSTSSATRRMTDLGKWYLNQVIHEC